MRRARTGDVVWAVVTRSGGVPIVAGSHYGVLIDPTPEEIETVIGGVAWSGKSEALADLATRPTQYFSGRPTGYSVARVRMGSSSDYWWDVP